MDLYPAVHSAQHRYARTRRWPLALPALLLGLASTPAPAITATWIGGDGSYTDASHWDTAPDVPLNGVGTVYDVVINGAGIDVSYVLAGAGTVDSLSLGAGTSFTASGLLASFQSLTTSANDATLVAEKQASLDLGGGNLDRSNLIARKGFLGSGGAVLTTGVTSWTGTNGFNLDRDFSADGAGSLLDLASLTHLERSGGSNTSDLRINATDGGTVDLSGLTAFADNVSGVNGRLVIGANGSGAKVLLPGVTALTDADLSVRDGGQITGQLVTLGGRSSLTLRSTGVIDLAALVNADNATLVAEDGGLLDLGTASIDQADLIARKGFLGSGGAVLTTSVTSWTGTNGFNLDRDFSADGAGSLLDLASLTHLERSGGSNTSDLRINATDGGTVDLSGLAAFADNVSGVNGRLVIGANGGGAKVLLPGVTALTDADLNVRDGGQITGQLVTLGGRSSLVLRSTGVIDLAALVNADNATLVAEDGGLLDLGTASIDQADLIARKGFLGSGGAVLTTSVTSWTGTNGFNLDRDFSADGAGSLLDLASLTHLERSGGSNTSDLRINATDGGTVDLSGLTAFADNVSGVNGRISVSATGAGSAIDLGQLAALDNANVTIADTASVDLGNLTAFAGGTLALTSTDGAAADLHVGDSLHLGTGGVLDVDGSSASLVIGPGAPAAGVDGAVVVAFGGALSGSGSVVGTLINDGLVGPGNSPGTLTVDGDYQQNPGAILDIEIGGSDQGITYDLLAILGSALLAGDVEVSLFDGFVPNLGESFVFLEAAGGISGTFDNIFCTSCAGVVFELFHGADFVSLTAVAAPVPLPAGAWLLLAPAGFVLARRRRA